MKKIFNLHRYNELLILKIDQVERIMVEPLPKIDPKSTIGRSFCQLALLIGLYSHIRLCRQQIITTAINNKYN